MAHQDGEELGPDQPLLTSVSGTRWSLVSLSLPGVTGQGREGQAQRSNDSRVQQTNWVSARQPLHPATERLEAQVQLRRAARLPTTPPAFPEVPTLCFFFVPDSWRAFPVGCLTLWNKVGNTLIFKVRQTKCQCVCVLGWKFLTGKDHVCLYSTWHSVKLGLNK